MHEMLHDLKEAPDVSGWSPYRQCLCKNAGPQDTAAEVELHRQCFPLLHQFTGRRSTTPEITRLLITSAFYLYGLRPALPSGFAAAWP
ncbi:hypothetical protein ACVTGX_24225 [Klebsiella grimontii]|uniref:hypothetical protein n=1 Tax=Klebsiella grimontii TaxID=2058152 RepID=UPI001CCC6E03|nr:hypothetical protein [Klebsiella grimontii]